MRAISLTIVGALCAGLCPGLARGGDAAAQGEIKAEHYTLTQPGALQNGLHEGGFSGLFHAAGDPADVVYAISDRGANSKLGADERIVFADPSHGPMIYKLKLAQGEAQILERIAPRLPAGLVNPFDQRETVNGLPNLAQNGEMPYDAQGQQALGYDPHGLDTEGIALNAADGTMWVCEEYSPSLAQLGMDGRIIRRLVPEGMTAKLGLAYAQDALPAVYARRQANRGFEGVAVTPDGRFLYAALQSALENPDAAAGAASRMTRIIKIDLTTGAACAEFAYAKEDAEPLGLRQGQIVISDLYALEEDRLIVDERDTRSGAKARIKRLYLADLTQATNILGQMDDAATGESTASLTLEQHTPEALAARQVTPPHKTLLLDLLAQGFTFEKIEGVCLLDQRSIAVVNDNDFGFEYEDGKIAETHQPTQISVYRLPAEID